MIEVVFNQSASIGLMMAQSFGKGNYPENHGTPAFMFYGGEKPSKATLEQMRAAWFAEERENWVKAVPLGGKKEDVFCFDLLLNIGGIGHDFGQERKRVIHRFDYAESEEAEQRIKESLECLEGFCQRVEDGDSVRIWFGREAEDMCGMLWLCNEMVRRELPLDKVYFVKLPVEKLNTGEVRDEEWWKFAGLQTLIELEEIQFYANQWEALREANTSLRVIVDDNVLSATEDYYDEMIWQEIQMMDGEFRQSKLVGQLLEQQIGIRDSWITYRLENFLETEALELVAVDHEDSWNRILRERG